MTWFTKIVTTRRSFQKTSGWQPVKTMQHCASTGTITELSSCELAQKWKEKEDRMTENGCSMTYINADVHVDIKPVCEYHLSGFVCSSSSSMMYSSVAWYTTRSVAILPVVCLRLRPSIHQPYFSILVYLRANSGWIAPHPPLGLAS